MRFSKTIALAVIILSLASVTGCKPSEKNYRAAYETTMAAREADATDYDNTVYTRIRRQMKTGTAVVGGDTLAVNTQFVAVTPDGGCINESIKRYCVVVGQFKQVFTAKNMRERLVDAGYPGAFVVQTREPYYFVVAGAMPSLSEAAALLKRAEADSSLVMRPPLPFILQPSQLAK